MKLSKPKTLNEKIKEFKFEEVTPETVAEQKKEKEEITDKAMEPAVKSAEEIVKETAAPDVRTRKQKRLVKDRKELAFLVKEAKEHNHKFTISRSLKEGYRYNFIETLNEDTDIEVEANNVEVSDEVKINAAESIVNGLIQDKFSEIDNIKSAIATLQLNEVNQDAIDILNSMLDEATIQVGMFQKVVEIINPDSKAAIEAGKEKAENIISTEEAPAEETTTETVEETETTEEEDK